MHIKEKELTFKSEINNKSKVLYYTFVGFLFALGAACLAMSARISFIDHWAIGLLLFIPGALVLLVVAGMVRNAPSSYTVIRQFRSDSFYDYFHFPDKKIENEQVIPYENIERIYLGRITRSVPSHDYSVLMANPAVVVQWSGEEHKEFRLVSLTYDELVNVLNIMPKTIPLVATKYDLSQTNDATVGIVLESNNDLIPVERKNFAFPYKLGQVESEDVIFWEPIEVKNNREEKVERLRQKGNRIFYGILGFIFLSGIFLLPQFSFENGWFANLWSLITIPSLMGVLGYFIYAFESGGLWSKAWLLGRHILFILAAYLSGSLLGNVLFAPVEGFVDAVIIEATVAIMAIAVTYVLIKVVYVVFIFGRVILGFAGLTPKELKKSMRKNAS
ncbi:hypothetical protein EQV77_08205 [Halobacillus fulvus]|nr:hypothetical protein EQV77_08205 [Halobacillus fulvus]